jgi:hypothetical protein
MSDIVEVKVRLDKVKKQRFDVHCRALGVSANNRLNIVIDADLEGRIAQDVIARPARDLASEAETRRAEFAQLRRDMSALHDAASSKLKEQLTPLKALPTIGRIEARFSAMDTKLDSIDTRTTNQETRQKDVFTTFETKQETLARDLRRIRPAWNTDPRFFAGLLGGLGGAFLLISILSNFNWTARILGHFATGESEPARAAALLAGEGNTVSEGAIRAILQLSDDERFREDFHTCASRANASKTRVTCALTLPGLL